MDIVKRWVKESKLKSVGFKDSKKKRNKTNIKNKQKV